MKNHPIQFTMLFSMLLLCNAGILSMSAQVGKGALSTQGSLLGMDKGPVLGISGLGPGR